MTIIFNYHIYSQELNNKIIFIPESKEETNLVINLNNYLKICFINTPQRSIKYFPKELFQVIRENSSIYLSNNDIKNKLKNEAREKKNRLPLGNKKFITHNILSRVEQENHIIYVVSHSIVEDNLSDRLSSSINRKNNDDNEPLMVILETICIYNKFNNNWNYFEHKNKLFSQQVLGKMFEFNTVLEILNFNIEN
ncbi:MAG: hypothetical protein CMP49_03270 [Flavobacteriales bacterium]|nr:hypothetical protein [Flavobacteriales bacterium]